MKIPCLLALLAIPLFLSTGLAAAQGRPDNRQDNGAQTEFGSASEWMLEVVAPNGEPDYLEFPDAGLDAEGIVDLHPTEEGKDQNDRTARATLELTYRFVAGNVRVHASVHFAMNRDSSHATTTVPVGDFVVPPHQPVVISQLIQFGLKSVELRLVSARPPDPTLLPVSNNTSSLIVENVDEDRNCYHLTVRNVSGLAVEGVPGAAGGSPSDIKGPPPPECSQVYEFGTTGQRCSRYAAESSRAKQTAITTGCTRG